MALMFWSSPIGLRPLIAINVRYDCSLEGCGMQPMHWNENDGPCRPELICMDVYPPGGRPGCPCQGDTHVQGRREGALARQTEPGKATERRAVSEKQPVTGPDLGNGRGRPPGPKC